MQRSGRLFQYLPRSTTCQSPCKLSGPRSHGKKQIRTNRYIRSQSTGKKRELTWLPSFYAIPLRGPESSAGEFNARWPGRGRQVVWLVCSLRMRHSAPHRVLSEEVEPSCERRGEFTQLDCNDLGLLRFHTDWWSWR